MRNYRRSLTAAVAASVLAASSPASAFSLATFRDAVLESGWWQIIFLPPNPCSIYRCYTR